MSSFVVVKDGCEYFVPRDVEAKGGAAVEAWLAQAEAQAAVKDQQVGALFPSGATEE